MAAATLADDLRLLTGPEVAGRATGAQSAPLTPKLNQVFMNLFTNATQAIEKDGVIRIKTFSDGTHAYVRITDTGRGIPPENLSKIFDPGFTTKGVGVGTGLGLSISYNIIRKHKGEIRVESQVGRGTELTLKLPIHETRSWSGGASISTTSSGSDQSLA